MDSQVLAYTFLSKQFNLVYFNIAALSHKKHQYSLSAAFTVSAHSLSHSMSVEQLCALFLQDITSELALCSLGKA